eukprot:gene2562-5481_t
MPRRFATIKGDNKLPPTDRNALNALPFVKGLNQKLEFLIIFSKYDQSLMFYKLPSKRELPIYYETIETPIDLALIHYKIKKRKYDTVGELFDDLHLMVENAQKFNEPASEVYEDAQILRQTIFSLFKKYIKEESENKMALTDEKALDSNSLPESSEPTPKRCELSSRADNADGYGVPTRTSSRPRKPKYRNDGDFDQHGSFSKHSSDRKPETPSSPSTPLSHHKTSALQKSYSINLTDIADPLTSRCKSTSSTSLTSPASKVANGMNNKDFQSVINTVLAAQKGNRKVADMFMELPSKKEFPEYYQVITKPMDINTILKRINRGSIQSFNQLKEAFDLVFDNAQIFNEDDSQVHRDAIYLQRIVHAMISRLQLKQEENAKREPDKYAPLAKRVKTVQTAATSGEPVLTAKKPQKSPKITIKPPTPSLLIKKSKCMTTSASNVSTLEPSQDLPKRENLKLKLKLSERKMFKTINTTKKLSVQDKCKALFELIQNARDPTDEDRRELAEMFCELPPRDTPMYYDTIKHPISLKEIKTRITGRRYRSFDQCINDLTLMFENAKKYNEPGSQIYQDSVTLLNLVAEASDKLNNGIMVVNYEQETEMGDIDQSADNLKEGSKDHVHPSADDKQDQEVLTVTEDARLVKSEPVSNKLSAEHPTKSPKKNNTSVATKVKNSTSRKGDNDGDDHKGAVKPALPHLVSHSYRFAAWRIAAHFARSVHLIKNELLAVIDWTHLLNILQLIMQPYSPEKIRTSLGELPRPPQKWGRVACKFFFSRIAYYRQQQSYLIDAFTTLPDDPNYSNIIPNAICISDIYHSLMESYTTGEDAKSDVEFVNDLSLVFINGLVYNGPKSTEGQAAEKMLRVLRRIGQACFEKHTVLQCSSLKPAPLITQIGLEVITTLRYLSRDDRNLSSEFLALPDPIEMEEYYELIEAPIALSTIHLKLLKCVYNTLVELVDDFKLLFRNARVFNEPDSQVYKDVVALEKEFVEIFQKVVEPLNIHSPVANLTHQEMVSEFELQQSDILSVVPVDSIDPSDVKQEIDSMTTSNLYTGTKHQESEVIKPRDYVLVYNHFSFSGESSLPFTPALLIFIYSVTYFYRPRETFHVPTRSFYKNEVLLSTEAYVHPARHILRKCLVLFCRDYIKNEVRQFPPDDVFIVESRYNANQKATRPIKLWSKPVHHQYLVSRKPISLSSIPKVKSVFFDNFQRSSNPNGPFGVEMDIRNVPADATTSSITHFKTFYFEDKPYSVGEFVYVQSDEEYPYICRILDIWVDASYEPYIQGMWFYRPHEVPVEDPPTFYMRELLRGRTKDVNSLRTVLQKCIVLSKRDFLRKKTLHMSSWDTYFCQWDYNAQEKIVQSSQATPSCLSEYLLEYSSMKRPANLRKIYHPRRSASRSSTEKKTSSYFSDDGDNHGSDEELEARFEPVLYTRDRPVQGHVAQRAKLLPPPHVTANQKFRQLQGNNSPNSYSDSDRVTPIRVTGRVESTPPSGFRLFCREERRRMRAIDPTTRLETSDLNRQWQQLAPERRSSFECRAEAGAIRRGARDTPKSGKRLAESITVHHDQSNSPKSSAASSHVPPANGGGLQASHTKQQFQNRDPSLSRHCGAAFNQSRRLESEAKVGTVLSAQTPSVISSTPRAQLQPHSNVEAGVSYSDEYVLHLQALANQFDNKTQSESEQISNSFEEHQTDFLNLSDDPPDNNNNHPHQANPDKIAQLFRVMSELFSQGQDPMTA